MSQLNGKFKLCLILIIGCFSLALLGCGDLLNPPDTSLILISPNGGEQWEMGSQHEIIWSAHNVPYIEIQYSIDGGINWEWIISENDSGVPYPASKKSYLWTVPLVISNETVTLIKEFDPNKVIRISDMSEKCFSIIGSEQFNELLKFYPLASGNKWIYNCSGTYLDREKWQYVPFFYSTIIEAKKDTIMFNNKKYIKLISSVNSDITKGFYLPIDFQRLDTLTYKVYRFDLEFPTRNFEYLIDDLFASPGSMIKSHRFMFPAYYTWAYSAGTEVMLEKEIEIFSKLTSLKEYSERDHWHSDTYQLVKGIGLYYHKYQGEFSTIIEELNGCIVNSEVFGDTTVTP
jgi:hypothetical protein